MADYVCQTAPGSRWVSDPGRRDGDHEVLTVERAGGGDAVARQRDTWVSCVGHFDGPRLADDPFLVVVHAVEPLGDLTDNRRQVVDRTIHVLPVHTLTRDEHVATAQHGDMEPIAIGVPADVGCMFTEEQPESQQQLFRVITDEVEASSCHSGRCLRCAHLSSFLSSTTGDIIS